MAVAAAELRLSNAMKALAPWLGTLETLSATIVPDVRFAEEIREIARKGGEQRLNLERLIEDLKSATNQCDGRISKLRQGSLAVSGSDITEARQGRDAQWGQIVISGDVPRHAEAFGAAIKNADVLADDRYEGATESHQLDQALLQREQQIKDLEQADTNLDRSQQDTRHAEEQWATRMQTLGLNGLQPDQYTAWLAKRTEALRRAEELESARSTSLSENRGAEESLANLAEAVAAAKIKDADPHMPLAGLVTTVEAYVTRIQQARIRNEQAAENLKQARAQIPALRERQSRVEDEFKQWERDWAEALSQARLDSATVAEAAEAAIVLMESIQSNLDEIHKKQTERIDTMNADLENFANSARGLASSLAPDLAQIAPEDIAEQLVQRFEIQTARQAERQHVKKEVQRHCDGLGRAKEAVAQVHATLKPLLDLAGVKNIDELRRRVEESDRRRTLETELAQAESTLRNQSDGLRDEALEVEIAAEDVETIDQRLPVLAQQKYDADVRRTDAIRNQQSRQAALRAWGGGDAAATAAAQREEAAAEIERGVEEYLRLKISERLLSEGIEAFRLAHQGPMLERSSALFAQLTRGSFTGLAVDLSAVSPVLIGERQDFRTTTVSGMSDGTRDQLYLALRLAAVQLHVDNASALPFIADDLFMTFDDDRAAAGFRALAELSPATQVLYFTHHAHLIDVARRAIGPQINVVQL